MKILRLRGFHLERLLSRARCGGVHFKTIRRTGRQEMTLCCREGDELARMAAEGGITCVDTRSVGVSAWLERLWKRRTLAAGLLAAAMILALFASRIWVVRVLPAEGELSEAVKGQVLSALRDMGVRAGCEVPDPLKVSRALAAACGDLVYVDVRERGACLSVYVTCADTAPDIYTPDAARDLVAARDGVVLSVEVLCGEAAVRIGDTVKKGDTLIAGSERISDEATRGIRALGSVIARVWAEGEASAPIRQTVTGRTGRVRTETALVCGGLEFPIGQAEPFAQSETETRILPVVGMFLPLCVRRSEIYETKTVTGSKGRSALEAELKEAALGEAMGRSTGDVLRVWTETQWSEDTATVRAVVETAADIAVSR